MRKNVYDKRIVMVNYHDISRAFGYVFEEPILNRLRMYEQLIDGALTENHTQEFRDCSREFGILINDKIDEHLELLFETNLLETTVGLDLTSIQNAFMYAVVNENDTYIEKSLEKVVMDMAKLNGDKTKDIMSKTLNREQFVYLYGQEILDYILSHGKYQFPLNYDPTMGNDKLIMLCHDGIIEKVLVESEKDYSRTK